MCEGASKQSQDLKNYTALGPRPTVYKFLDPPLKRTIKSQVLSATALSSPISLLLKVHTQQCTKPGSQSRRLTPKQVPLRRHRISGGKGIQGGNPIPRKSNMISNDFERHLVRPPDY